VIVTDINRTPGYLVTGGRGVLGARAATGANQKWRHSARVQRPRFGVQGTSAKQLTIETPMHVRSSAQERSP
jgi:hypothetical protein